MEYLSLQKNYRSKAEIVQFNNELFSSVARQVSASKYAPLFENINAQEERGLGGFVSRVLRCKLGLRTRTVGSLLRWSADAKG